MKRDTQGTREEQRKRDDVADGTTKENHRQNSTNMGLVSIAVSSAAVLVSPLWLLPQIYVFALCTLPIRVLRASLGLLGLHYRPQLLAEFAIVLYQYVAVAFVLGAVVGVANWMLFSVVKHAVSWIDGRLRVDTAPLFPWMLSLMAWQDAPDAAADADAAAAAAPKHRQAKRKTKHETKHTSPPASAPACASSSATAVSPDVSAATPPALPERPSAVAEEAEPEIIPRSTGETVTTQTRTHVESVVQVQQRARTARPPSEADTTVTTAVTAAPSSATATANSSFEDSTQDEGVDNEDGRALKL